MVTFPNATHDDDCDSTSQALNRFMYYSADIPIEQKKISKELTFDFEKEEENDMFKVLRDY